ncbi:MAG: hypothetical protein ACO398_04975, partial [Kiritimatiellia bacterium]
PEYYRGMAMVHWTLTLDQRAIGWLQALFHARFREILLHTCCRYGLCCPVYCLMPDHLHQIWLGEKQSANQLFAMRFFRQQVARWLHPFKLQKQAYDNVLREKDREQDAFRATCFYILENPVRAGLVTNAKEWEFSGCMMPGFPDLHPLDERFDRVFWGRYSDLARGNTPP